MKNEQNYDKELSILKEEALTNNIPLQIAEYRVLAEKEVKKIILEITKDDKMNYAKFRLRKLSIDLATIEILFTQNSSIFTTKTRSELCEIEIDEEFFQLLELAFLNGNNNYSSSAKPFVLNIPSNASNVITPEEEMQESLSVEDKYLDELGISNLDNSPGTTLEPTYRQTEKRTANKTTSRCGTPPKADDTRVDGSKSDYSRDSMGMDSRRD